ncbi:unnamed protein product [Phytomonas sp. EM1]|nr:unnamed protein product [Phytomonas sp. EM1]|eukprot:CCW64344.1 unnamed protein product [Phytomonas sp. isolate EM1]
MAQLRSLVGSALFFVLSVFLVILACTTASQRNAWPLICFILYCLAIIPLNLAVKQWEYNIMDFDEASFNSLSLFLSGVCLASGPLLALVLYHTNNISVGALLLTWCSGMSFLGMCLIMFTSDSNDDDDFLNA